LAEPPDPHRDHDQAPNADGAEPEDRDVQNKKESNYFPNQNWLEPIGRKAVWFFPQVPASNAVGSVIEVQLIVHYLSFVDRLKPEDDRRTIRRDPG
jgi:hypothetical protein